MPGMVGFVTASQVSAQIRMDALRADHVLPVLMQLMQCHHRRQSGSFPPGCVSHLPRFAFHLVFAELILNLFEVWAGMNSAGPISSLVYRMKVSVVVFRLNQGRLGAYLGRVKA
jgi:hypothetical protein